jgi:hypothetical protein
MASYLQEKSNCNFTAGVEFPIANNILWESMPKTGLYL